MTVDESNSTGVKKPDEGKGKRLKGNLITSKGENKYAVYSQQKT